MSAQSTTTNRYRRQLRNELFGWFTASVHSAVGSVSTEHGTNVVHVTFNPHAGGCLRFPHPQHVPSFRHVWIFQFVMIIKMLVL